MLQRVIIHAIPAKKPPQPQAELEPVLRHHRAITVRGHTITVTTCSPRRIRTAYVEWTLGVELLAYLLTVMWSRLRHLFCKRKQAD